MRKTEIPAIHAKHFVGVAHVAGDGDSRIGTSRFIAPPVVADHCNASANALAYLCVMLAADDIDETLGRFANHSKVLAVPRTTHSDNDAVRCVCMYE